MSSLVVNISCGGSGRFDDSCLLASAVSPKSTTCVRLHECFHVTSANVLCLLLITVAVDGASGTMTGTFRCILVSDGVTGLYRGLAANFLKVAPAVSISYIVYEKTRSLLGVTMT